MIKCYQQCLQERKYSLYLYGKLVSCQHSLYLIAVRTKMYNNNEKVSLKAGILDRKLKMKYFQFVGLCLTTVCLARLCQAPFLLQSLLWSSFIYISLCHSIHKEFSMTAPSHVLHPAKPNFKSVLWWCALYEITIIPPAVWSITLTPLIHTHQNSYSLSHSSI